jgi:hypothetical protein
MTNAEMLIRLGAGFRPMLKVTPNQWVDIPPDQLRVAAPPAGGFVQVLDTTVIAVFKESEVAWRAPDTLVVSASFVVKE